jgi:polysaccharide deacetylase 2 family uncharacterized protein YibQ
LDDLNTPLGKKPARSNARWKTLFLPLVTTVFGAMVIVAVAWVVLVDDPLGGEPMATAKLDLPQPKASEKSAAPDKAAQSEKTAGEKMVTIIDGKSGARTEVPVGAGNTGDQPAGAMPVADPRLLEESRHGPIPRMAADGARPLDVYSRADATDTTRKGPRIAIVISGLGISANATGDSIAKLPASVTLAFAPHAAELQRWTAKARGAGHEILLQLPMEPFDYPDNDPGPHTLLTSLPKDQNIDRLHWVLSRMQGYVGVANFMGSRFTSNEPAFAPVLTELAQRGLLYFDDGASSRSLAQKLAASSKTPFVKADVVIDAKPNWSDIDAALEQLERIAADRDYAIGFASALPVSIERIARWAKGAEGRGVRIVPLSVAAIRARQS